MKSRLLSTTLTACAVAGVALAQSNAPVAPDKALAIDLSQIMQAAGEGPGASGKGENLPPFAEVTKGMKPASGFFTLWSYPADAKDKDQERLLAQIPQRCLGEKFMLSTSMSGGGFMTGFPLDERVVMWQVQGRQLVLVEPETRYVADPSKDITDVVQRTYPERIRAAVPMLTKSPEGDPVIDLGPFLKSNFADILWTADGFGMARMGGGMGVNAELSKWVTRKTFELNTELGVELAIGRASPPGSFDKKRVHYSFWRLPQTDYQPRVADERVGYFLTTNSDWSKPVGERELFNRYVNRWHLVKRDASLDVCEPRQPIIFYIEKTVPVKFRRAVREGILEWNKAYEKVGFANAVEVRQQTSDNEWKDLDPEDMRYSFFRWIVTGAGFAMGPSRANPFTGQIYDADIIFDDSMVRFYAHEIDRELPAAAFQTKFEDPVIAKFLEQFPQWRRPNRDWERVVIGDDQQRELRALARERLAPHSLVCCDYARGMRHQVMLGQAVLAAHPPEVVDRFLFDVVKEVVMHEVGHTLGLRHNFKASTVYSVDEIQKRRQTNQPTTGSVMDYNPALLFAKNSTEGRFVTPTIGPYDYWAIEYGYRPYEPGKSDEAKSESKSDKPAEEPKKPEAPPTAGTPATPPAGAAMGKVDLNNIPKEILEQLPAEAREALASGKAMAMLSGTEGGFGGMAAGAGGGAPAFRAAPTGEETMLRKIAGRASEPELAYATDEDTTPLAPDPRSNRFDLGSDPVDYARERITLCDQRLANILEWAVKDQESWYFLRGAYLTLMMEKATVLDYVGRYVGGQYFHRTRRGDAGAASPFVIVEPEKQRRAMAFIEEHLFSDKFYAFRPEVLNHLAPSRWWHDGTSIDLVMDFPVLEYVSAMQWWNLFDRLFPNNLRRIHDAELKTASLDKFTVAEYLQRLQKACWSDATDAARLGGSQWTDAAPFLSVFRRSLQREYLGLIEPIVRSRPGDAVSPDLHAMVQFGVRKLGDELGAVIGANKADFASQAHLVSCKSRIDRMLAAELREYEGGGMSMGVMFRETEGQPRP